MSGKCMGIVSVVVIMNQLGIMWDAGASVGVLVACLLLIAEQNAHQICLTNCKLFAIQWHGTAVCAASTPLTFFYWTYKYILTTCIKAINPRVNSFRHMVWIRGN